MTQCKGHAYKTAEITLLCYKVLCFLYTVSITSVQKVHSTLWSLLCFFTIIHASFLESKIQYWRRQTTFCIFGRQQWPLSWFNKRTILDPLWPLYWPYLKGLRKEVIGWTPNSYISLIWGDALSNPTATNFCMWGLSRRNQLCQISS